MSNDAIPLTLNSFLSTWLSQQLARGRVQQGMVVSTQATTLYADVSGFTQLTSAFADQPDGASQLHDTLNQYYATLIDTIGAYGGDVTSIAGDALTAWWPEISDRELGCTCGKALLDTITQLPAIITPHGSIKLHLRIGVSTGLINGLVVGTPEYGCHFLLAGPGLRAAIEARQTCPPKQLRYALAPEEAGEAELSPESTTPSIAWHHFLPRPIAQQLARNQLVAGYRRCLPVFAAFEVPPKLGNLHLVVRDVQVVVARWGGELNEIELGDKGPIFVLLFGRNGLPEQGSCQAVGCCLELRQRGLITCAGITLGQLFVGAVGNTRRRVYTAQGEEMNLAAHLMQQARSGDIFVSGRVRSDMMGCYPTSEPEMIRTKGHRQGIPVNRVLAYVLP
ncbi:hypothetical protein EYB53_007775 [Candidatus Chloroploca sp. M-50]|uniref:Guanylate cyclase domain-containing protein n=1 Tax=Candidatus Chloroploca mongolica TaxID=2528176 RepID=A0ABS4D839_9CHLR|nr:adenylate/guanylate cyclase domain-containing protein [Candidatus Chloroploca mongolica]MBP1465601.1 hypothetical protein [Candidatus Chloroploca mongolica]